MTSSTRSQSLVRFSVEQGVTTTEKFTCPAGYVTLVKNLYAFSFAAAAVTFNWGFLSPDMSRFLWFDLSDLAPQTLYTWQGWMALNPGDEVSVTLQGGPSAVWVSGAILIGPPPFPPNV